MEPIVVETEQVVIEHPTPVSDDQATISQLQREVEMLRTFERDQREQAEVCETLRKEWEDAKELAAGRKKSLDEALQRLVEIGRTRPSLGPLFDSNGSTEEPFAEDPPADSTDSEIWRLTHLDAIGIVGKTAELLAKNDPPLTTLGQIADWTKDHRLCDVAGIGEAKAADIEALIDAYWARHDRSRD
jgi:TolA-binding protein